MITRYGALICIAVLPAACGRADDSGAASVEPPAVTATQVELRIPPGDPAEGRQAFIDLRCTYCHAVSAEADLPPLISANPGPELTPEHAAQSSEALADSIISPAHLVEPQKEEALSHMGDYSRSMTVRQLIDLVAYLKSIRE